MAAPPVFLSPALPSELLSYTIQKTAYPTTVIFCCSRKEFQEWLGKEIVHQEERCKVSDEIGKLEDCPAPRARTHTILSTAPLYQIAIARHIRVIFTPTVTHLRAFISTLPYSESKIRPPPKRADHKSAPVKATEGQRQPLLLLYGLLELHRNTSEWSAQGLSNTTAALVEVARQTGFQAIVIEPRTTGICGTARELLEAVLAGDLPVLSGAIRRKDEDGNEDGWAGRVVDVRRVLGRWFDFKEEDWGRSTDAEGPEKRTTGV